MPAAENLRHAAPWRHPGRRVGRISVTPVGVGVGAAACRVGGQAAVRRQFFGVARRRARKPPTAAIAVGTSSQANTPAMPWLPTQASTVGQFRV